MFGKTLVVLFGIVFISCCLANDEAPTGKRVLVVLDNLNIKSSHSIFFKSLEERGYTLDFTLGNDESLELKRYGEWKYDHLILFAPSSEGIPVASVLEFIDDGHNVFIAVDSKVSNSIKEIASECNVEFDDSETSVIDHLNFDVSDFDGDHTLLVADNYADVPNIVTKSQEPVLFRGIGQDIEEDSELLFTILSGSSTSYSHSLSEVVEDLHVSGKKTSLVSALQARNNARVIFSGSLELFSDKFFNSHVQKYTADGTGKKFEKSGNEHFAKQLVQWAFQEKGILRARNVHHHRVGETETPAVYTIKEDVEYSIEIEEWNGRRWVPYSANDVQLEYIMLDPYVRTFLKPDTKGKFTTQFKLPDIYGVFTFKIEYVKKGYGFLTSISRVPVRPFRHNQYERFLPSAFPYYAGAFSMMVGLFLFSWFFLYHRDKTN